METMKKLSFVSRILSVSLLFFSLQYSSWAEETGRIGSFSIRINEEKTVRFDNNKA